MKNKIFSITIMITLVLSMLNISATRVASKTDYITIKKFIEMTMKESSIGKNYKDAIKLGIVIDNEFDDITKFITNEEAAIILARTWNVLYGDTSDNKTKTKDWFLDQVLSLKLKDSIF